MEVAGTAVGIASLGIQVCQGLLSYYADWQEYNANISNTYKVIVDLSKTLTLLKSSLENEELDPERVERVRTCLIGCEDTICELGKKRHNLQKYSSPERMRQKVRSELQRLWYPLKKETLEDLKANVVNIQERLKLALQVLQLDTAVESKKLLVGLRRQATAQGESLAQVSAQNQRILDVQQSDEYRKIAAWLSAPDPWVNHESARRRHEVQTGDWLLQSDRYQRWKSGDHGPLWLYGKAGCGKTILCSTVIEDVKRYCESKASTEYSVFYFTFSDEHKQSDGDLLRSLVAQLGWREPSMSMLRQAYGSRHRSIPSTDELQKILLVSIRLCERVFLLMDAIDECPEDRDVRQSVLDRVERLTQGAPNLQIFATSRELPAFREPMVALGFECVRIATSAVDADIRTYVANELSRHRSFRRFGPATLDLIKATIVRKANGMFRWVYCQLQVLKKLKSTAPKYVKRVLDTLPATLDDTYTRVLLEIEDMYHEHALTLLRWLVYARSPPTLGQLAEAAIIDPFDGSSSIDVENRGDLEDTLNILSGLVTVEGYEEIDAGASSVTETSTLGTVSAQKGLTAVTPRTPLLSPSIKVRLAHFSVKEYLESKRILGSDARTFHLESAKGHEILARNCLTYLRYYDTCSDRTSMVRDLETFPLLEYAAQSWYQHSALRQNADEASFEASLLQDESARLSWLLIHDPERSWRVPFDVSSGYGSAIYYASLFGLHSLVRDLLSSGAEVNAQGGFLGNALQAAACKSDTTIVQLLLNNNVDVSAEGGHFGNAFQAASYKGNKEVIQLLLDSNADVNAKGGHFGSAFQAASFRGDEEVIQLLLDKGAEVSAQGGFFGNALQAAAARGYTDIACLVIDNGADVNAQGGHYGNALQAAAAEGHIDMARRSSLKAT